MKPYTDIEQSRLNTMTQAEKAKRYDVAVKVIKDNLDALNEITETGAEIVNIQAIKNCFYRAFPELRESEDERIRKWLINTIKEIPDGSIEWETISKSDVLAWLDRPSEENPADKVEPKFHEGDSIYQVASANDGSHYEWNDDKKVLKKIADKVEPKFKVGDWIVQENIGVYKVIEICESWYEVIDAEHNHYSISFGKEYMCHLWDIEDAKPGDVLTNDYHILILKELDYDWYNYGTPDSVHAYCGIKPNGNFEIGIDNWCFCGTLHIHPATKEQRDLLFQKMKEAGYEWDADKKELKKIEPKFKVGDWVVYDGWTTQILQVCQDGYVNNHQGFIPKEREDAMRLWDISDAKDGDVLVTNSGRPFIYKGCLDPNNPNSPVAYCGIDTEGHLFAGADKSNRWWTDEEVHPATKEQREQLEKAMVDYVKC